MFANPARIPRFRTRLLTGVAWARGVPAVRVHADAETWTAHPVLIGRWVAGAGGGSGATGASNSTRSRRRTSPRAIGGSVCRLVP